MESLQEDAAHRLGNRLRFTPPGARRHSSQKMMQDGAQAEDIAPLVRQVHGEPLGGGVLGGIDATNGWLGPVLCKPEPDELHQSAVVRSAGDEDSVRREVSVKKARIVGGLKSGRGLEHQI
jgi:hypothetical protein